MTAIEELVYPCETAPLEKMDEMLQRIYNSVKHDTDDLVRFIYDVTPRNIRWEKLRHLRIVGDDNNAPVENFELKGISRGFHMNADGSWLLLILPEKPNVSDYFSRCGKYLESLAIMNTQMYSRDWSKLSGLRELYLEDNRLLDSIGQISCLKKLEQLSIVNCPKLTRIHDLEKLTSLSELNISRCDNITALPGLEKLTQLSKIWIVSCKGLISLAILENRMQLTELLIRGCIKLTDLPRLEYLPQLTKLHLHSCDELTALPGLEKLVRLTELTIAKCENITCLSGLENLTQLTKLLIIGCSGLTTLPSLENLTRLTELNISACMGLTTLPGLKYLSRLEELDLSRCSSINRLPEDIRHLRQLRFLDLSFLQLKELPDWLPEISEYFTTDDYIEVGKKKASVWLFNTTVEDIKEMSVLNQPYEMVVEYFEKRRQGKNRPLNEIKVVFLGDGEAGKSHTIARLMNDGGAPKGYVNVRTPGIVIKDVKYPVGDREATLHLWDFGGQDIMHSMHRIFLTQRTIYVVLVDGSIGNQDERARYWLQNIQSFAKDAPVVLVLNKLDDGLQADVNAVDLRNKYKGLKQIVKLSALQYTQERFNHEFKDVLLEEIDKSGYLDADWPVSWIRVKEALEQMDANYIHGGDYLKLCKDLDVNKNQQSLLRWFHDLGISFCYCDDENKALEDYVVLKPNWITNALYIIVFNEREGGNGGLVPIRTIRNMLGWDAPNKDAIKRVIPDAFYVGYDVNYVLDVFHAFKLSFPKDDQHEFFPMLADINAKPVAKEYAEAEDCLEFNMEFDYLPNNLLHRLMVERHSELDMANVWRTGARFQLRELGLSAVVVIDGNILHFFVRYTDSMYRPNTYLTMLKASVDRIVEKMGLKAPTNQLIYKLDGKRDIFDYEKLKLLLEVGQTHELSISHKKMIPIVSILSQSAPDGLEDERKLLDAIKRSCHNIQGEPDYRLNGDGRGMEDKRNRRIRDDLFGWGYNIQDQTQRGRSGTGNSIGELDLLLHNDKRELWTTIEALRVSNGDKREWKKHLNKLIGNYNFFGAPYLYLLTYVDADPTAFARIWKDYQKRIKEYNPGQYTIDVESYVDLNDTNSPQYIKVAKCQYTCGGDPITVYHIFARIPTQNE